MVEVLEFVMKMLAYLSIVFAATNATGYFIKCGLMTSSDETRTGWTVLENRGSYEWCHALIGSRPDVIEDAMVKTRNFGNVYIYKSRKE